ncbi:MAG: hypothetical protein ACODTL_16165 [Brucella sp.]
MLFNPIVGADAVRKEVADYFAPLATQINLELQFGGFVSNYVNSALSPKTLELNSFRDNDDAIDDMAFITAVNATLETHFFGAGYWFGFNITTDEEHIFSWMQWLVHELVKDAPKAISAILVTGYHDHDTETDHPLDMVIVMFIKEQDAAAFQATHVGRDYTYHPQYGLQAWKNIKGIV